MQEVTVVIPNYNGKEYLKRCLAALQRQSYTDFQTLVVDNGSSDGSLEWLKRHVPKQEVLALGKNYGFCRAVNEGICASHTPYVILLNNDTEPEPQFVEELLAGMKRHKNAFSGSAKMLQKQNTKLIDDAGNYYNALGWGFARGKDKPQERYSREQKVFACCAGAAIYRREFLEQTGYFDEKHFAYLEDLDLGYRARILGYENWYLPKACVVHVGSATSGSRYNLFKVKYSSRNNVYLIYKNMPPLQLLLNLPLLLVGFAIKTAFFIAKGYGKEYLGGLYQGLLLCKKERQRRVKFRKKNLGHYMKIQWELWLNIFRRF